MENSGDEHQIGGDVRRIDGRDKVTGQTRYIADIQFQDLLHAKVLRSPYHHARLISLDTQMAADYTDEIGVVTKAFNKMTTDLKAITVSKKELRNLSSKMLEEQED